ncbi:MAG: restriction endonuclease [Chitinophagaceae bacterium]|nr:MAG: restriction endonuclease [Chitinophagaceae bacterium]
MRVKKIEMLISSGDFSLSEDFQDVRANILLGIEAVEWFTPQEFTINPTPKGNGVKPIKENFITTLRELGWRTEQSMSIVDGVGAGPIDAVKDTAFGKFAVEWETGNVSSSHRALNKIAAGIIHGHIIGGMLVVPVKDLAKYLTDRIGNFEELRPYFVVYKTLNIREGVIGVIAIEHDGTDKNAPLIPKGNDGNALGRLENT